MDYWQIWQILTCGIYDESSWGASSGAFVSLLAAQQRCSSPCFIFLGEGVLQGPILFTWYVQLSVSKRDIVFYIKFPRKSPCIVITMIRAFVLWKRLIAFVTCNARYFVLGCSGKLTDKLINLWTPKFIITRIKELMVSCPNEDHCVFGLIGDSPYWHSD